MASTVKTKQNAAADLLAFLPADRHAPFQAGRGEPLVVLHRIQATADGCQWLLERWDRLRASLEQDGSWDIEEMIAAAQLRGQRPLFMETADWECLVQERHVKGNPALVEEGRRQLLDQLTDGEWLAADPAGTRAALLRLVAEETARLEELKEARQQREAADRSELADRLAVDTTPDGERVRRYQLDCDRKLHRALQSLLKLRREEGARGGSGRRGRARAGRSGRAAKRPDAGRDGRPGRGVGTGRTGKRSDADGNGYPGDRDGNGGSDRAGRRQGGR